jgi:hypothetical protein
MSQIIKMIAAEGNTSSSQDELELLASASSVRRLAQTIIDKLNNNYFLLFSSLISANPNYLGEYDFGLVKRAFAEGSVASKKLNKGRTRYFMGPKDAVYRINGVDLYLSGEWYSITRTKPTPNHNWPSINDLIRVLNNRFHGTFVYVETDEKKHELWGPSDTL